MKNKLGILTIIIVGFMSACSSQENIDMAKISLPCDSNLILNSSIQFDKKNQIKNLQKYNSKDPKLMVFNGINLAFEISKEYRSQNNISIYKDENSSKINLLEFEIYTMNESRKLYQILINEFGLPLYYINSDEDSFSGVWENENATYVFEKSNKSVVAGIKTERSRLYIIDNNDLESIKYYTNSSYFGEFIDARAKKGDKNYSYEDWARDMEAEGDDDYIISLKKNKPLE